MPDSTLARPARQTPTRVAPAPAPRLAARPLARAADVALAVALGVFALPVVLAAALLVRATSRGPALYTQVRAGRGGKPFRIFKLRSMWHDCEAKTGARWAAGHADPRITPVGRVLRKLHIDELPQLWNVLKGDMALVGPRPERPEMLDRLAVTLPDVRDRLAVLPGLTGLAQIQQPADQTVDCFRRKLALDLLYAREQSAWLDARVLLGTILYLAGMPYAGVRRSARLPTQSTAPAVTASTTGTAEFAALRTAEVPALASPAGA